MGESNLDYSKIPLSALKKPAQNILSSGLNHQKIIPNSDGVPRDWRGIAHLIGLTGMETGRIASLSDPFMGLINHWGKLGNLALLQNYLSIIDRYDVLDDTKQLFESNSLEYIINLEKTNTQTANINLESDKVILTTDDVIRLENGMEPQTYDAYVLYAEEDANFAIQIVEKMESDYNLKLCIRDRDLIGGVQFEHDAITKLIAERCRRLVVIVSSNFLKSRANKFFVTFAQALALDIRERKVIPILYEKCNVPPELSYYFCLDFNRASKLWNFWEKLRDSIQGPEVLGKKAMVPSSVTTRPEHEYWISRTHFEDSGLAGDENERRQEKPSARLGGEPPETESSDPVKPSNKRKNVYKIIRNSFGKAVKNQPNSYAEKSSSKSNSLLATLTSFVSSESVLFENLENSSSFEGPDESLGGKKVKSKKKWFKKKSLETLLS